MHHLKTGFLFIYLNLEAKHILGQRDTTINKYPLLANSRMSSVYALVGKDMKDAWSGHTYLEI